MSRTQANFITIILVCIWFLLLFGPLPCAHADTIPEEPPLSELHRWYPVQDGTVILEYRKANKYAVQIWRYKHALKSTATKLSLCNEVTVAGDEIRLLTQEAKPSLYLIEKRSDGFSPEFNLDFTHELWR